MVKNFIENKGIEEKYTSTGRHSGYQVDLYHSGLDEYKHLSAVEYSALEGKIHNQTLAWNEKWTKEAAKRRYQSKDTNAKEQTQKAQEKLSKIESILAHTLAINDAIDWDTLKHTDKFVAVIEPHQFIKFDSSNGYPEDGSLLLSKPTIEKEPFFTKITFLQKILGQSDKIRTKQIAAFDNAVADRAIENERIEIENIARKSILESLRKIWKIEQAEFNKLQENHNAKVEELKKLYQEHNADAIVEYCEMVLTNSEYPDNFIRSYNVQYNSQNGMLLLDYKLPALKDIPNISSVRFVKSRNEIEEKFLSQTEHTKLYDLALYQIVLRTLHELFEADVINAITSITLNGVVTDISPATGHTESNCILSIQVTKEEFEKINLNGIVSNVSYKECFKSLKGVGSAKLSTMTAVKPILELNKTDKRFKDHYEVAHTLNDALNIAAMDWEDFEHLVREIFAKEFTANGGEVRVTQASVDGGVDAVAFDPDPIRGGKIVIQAKRYTNVVGVSAVRDLYGTVMNEGATKGILVTTSDYGADSYEFAKGKPLTLLNGSNLLHLLEKHGHKAKIDIKEAKKILKDQVA